MYMAVFYSFMSVALDMESGVNKEAYDQEFDNNHTVHDRKVATCTYGGGMACPTCE